MDDSVIEDPIESESASQETINSGKRMFSDSYRAIYNSTPSYKGGVSNVLVNTVLFCVQYVGFHEDRDKNTFGYFKKNRYIPQSNFIFNFISEVVCEMSPNSSGFLILVKEEGSTNAK